MMENEYTNEQLIDFMYDVMDWRDVVDHPMIYAVIEALKEIQQYRAIGTVEDIQQKLKNMSLVIDTDRDLLNRHMAIGTIEECRTAVERMKPKIKPAIEHYDIHKDGWCVCPNCVKGIGWLSKKDQNSFCRHCGAEFDWSE